MSEQADKRTVLAVSGSEREKFLQGLVTNDVRRLGEGPLYAALLTPQGKYLADFFLLARGETILVDADAQQAPALLKRLTMYRLRADVRIEPTDIAVFTGTGDAPPEAVADPRHPALGWRLYADRAGDDGTDWDALRVEHLVPLSGVELIPDETYILEAGFERLNGVDFRKGCYVGQEVTARMKHKTELKKGLARVRVDGPAVPVGTEITASGKPAGRLFTRSGGRAIAYLRFDRARGAMQAGDATVAWDAGEGS